MVRRYVHRALLSVSVVVFSGVVRATAALAQAYPGGGNTPPPQTSVQGKQFFPGNGNTGNTANTGTDILIFLLLAILALTIGLLLRRASQRRNADAAE